jgi:hypothetical protein
MKYKIAKAKITLFRISRRIGDIGEDIIFSLKKTFYKPELKEKTSYVLRKVSKIGDKIASNIKENSRNWGERIDSGASFKINKEDI